MPATTSSPRLGHHPDELRRARKEAGLTQNQVAALAGCSRAFVANVEQGYAPRYSPTLERILALLKSEAAPAGGPTQTDGAGAPGDVIAA